MSWTVSATSAYGRPIIGTKIYIYLDFGPRKVKLQSELVPRNRSFSGVKFLNLLHYRSFTCHSSYIFFESTVEATSHTAGDPIDPDIIVFVVRTTPTSKLIELSKPLRLKARSASHRNTCKMFKSDKY